VDEERRGSGEASNPGGDGLDEAQWEILLDGVIASHDGDAVAAHAATRRYAARVPFDNQLGAYLWYLLRYRVAVMVDGRPTAKELREISGRARLKFAAVIRGDQNLLENVLRTVFRMASPQEKVVEGQFVVLGLAALGVLLDDPAADMQSMRPQLADYWRRNVEKFRAEGILEDRSNAGGRLN
jgi:hypothetical protein